ncbi:class I SAM-dependent methyltransferase [Bacillus sp. REN10]|uniref:class I SAM-dependent methyltransferase n=1 Tax=Bacillus sp. REN10 TaxID=2782541 RepID=UPI001EEEA9A3|nr:class I SAM-dependent methyltransferase [Bacillus sp. REN10]
MNWTINAKDQWNEKANDWHAKSKQMWETGSRKDLVAFLAAHVQPPALVADLGCGDGYGSLKLHEQGYEVVGVDLSDKMVELAKAYNQEGMTFYQADLVQLPFEKESIQAIMAINSLEWTESPKDVLAEVKRVLVPKGKICAAILGPTAGPRTNSYPRLIGKKVVMNTMMPWEFSKLAFEQGFQLKDEYHVYKEGIIDEHVANLPNQLKQALTFMTVFMLEKQ